MRKFELGHQKGSLEKMIKTGTFKGSERVHAQFLVAWDEGLGLTDLGYLCDIDRVTAYKWKKRFWALEDENPITALSAFIQSRSAPGRPSVRKRQLDMAFSKVSPFEKVTSAQLAEKFQIPGRTIRHYLASHKRRVKK